MNKQQTAVEWYDNQLRKVFSNTTEASNFSHEELLEQAKEMEIAGKEMSYDDGYAEGYKRAVELTKWAISNLIPPHNESNP
jgi:hypothetical protein